MNRSPTTNKPRSGVGTDRPDIALLKALLPRLSQQEKRDLLARLRNSACDSRSKPTLHSLGVTPGKTTATIGNDDRPD